MHREGLLKKQYFLTVQASKRLIAKAVLAMPKMKKALEENTVVIVAGTTNSYLAQEFLTSTNQLDDFSRHSFFRGINNMPGKPIEMKNKEYANKDVVLVKGVWAKGKNIFDVADDLKQGDIMIKGGNAVNLEEKMAAVQILHPAIGTSAPLLAKSVGSRVELIIPVGIEKRVFKSINYLASLCNAQNATGTRLLPLPGQIITEFEAVHICSNGAVAELVAAGGVGGAEGGLWLLVEGTKEQLDALETVYNLVAKEEPFI